MAIKELLIKAVDAHRPGFKTDMEGCYKKKKEEKKYE